MQNRIWTMSIPDNALYDGATYKVDLSSLPARMQDYIENSTFLGSGASSAAWLLPNSTVLKLTTDEATWSLSSWQHQHKKPHLPKILELGKIPVTLQAFEHSKPNWESWYFLVQPLYVPVDPGLWNRIETMGSSIGLSHCKTRPGGCKTKNGLMAHGQLATEHLMALSDTFAQSKHSKIMQAACAVSALAQWWTQTRTRAGLDVDKPDNWAMTGSTGKLILLDPVYGNDLSQSGYHWTASV